MKIKVIAIAFFGVVLYSCSPKIVPADKVKKEESTTVSIAKEQNSELNQTVLSSDLAEGKMLFENNCAKCHKLYSPTDYKSEEWDSILKRMQPKARISDEERVKIYNYIIMN